MLEQLLFLCQGVGYILFEALKKLAKSIRKKR